MDKLYDIEELIKQGEVVEISPQGYSMYPLIVPKRDKAILCKVDEQEIQRGDVILFRHPDKEILVLHRVWKKTKEGLYLIGDNQKEIEGPIPYACVKGMMCALKRKGKQISVENVRYKFITGLWLWMRPMRFIIMKPLAFIKRMVKTVSKKIQD